MPADTAAATLEQKFPHTAALLEAISLEAVTAELTNVISFLSQTLGLSGAQLTQTLATSAPHLAQSLTALPLVTGGWANVPGTGNLTRFSGTPVHSGLLRQSMIAAIRASTLGNAPRRRRFFVRSAKTPSTRLSQDELVGTKCR